MEQKFWKSPGAIKKPLKFKFHLFLEKINKKWRIKEDNFLVDLDVYELKLLLLFADIPELKDKKLNYQNYSLKDFRNMTCILTEEDTEKKINSLIEKGLIKIDENNNIAFNYIYNEDEPYVKIPHQIVDLIKNKTVKRSKIKILFAILLLMYSDTSKGLRNMGTDQKKIKTSDIQRITGISERSIKNSVKALKEKGIIDYEVRHGKRDGNLFKIQYDYSKDDSNTNKNKKKKRRKKYRSNYNSNQDLNKTRNKSKSCYDKIFGK